MQNKYDLRGLIRSYTSMSESVRSVHGGQSLRADLLQYFVEHLFDVERIKSHMLSLQEYEREKFDEVRILKAEFGSAAFSRETFEALMKNGTRDLSSKDVICLLLNPSLFYAVHDSLIAAIPDAWASEIVKVGENCCLAAGIPSPDWDSLVSRIGIESGFSSLCDVPLASLSTSETTGEVAISQMSGSGNNADITAAIQTEVPCPSSPPDVRLKDEYRKRMLDESCSKVVIGATRALRGPNVWSQLTVLEVEVDLSGYQGHSASDIDAIRLRANSILSEVTRNDSGYDSAESTSHSSGLRLAELLARTLIELQQRAGCPVKFARVAELKMAGWCKIAVQYCEEPVGRFALVAAVELVKAAIDNVAFNAAERIAEIRSLDEQIRLGPSTGSIVRAALNRGIPARRLNDRSLVQLGYGCKQHRVLAAETDRTSAVAESIVQDKELTKQLLGAVGVPVPKGRPVTSAEDAWVAAQEIGVPVVIKPQDGNQGRGVACNLNTRGQVFAAYAAAAEEGDEIICEKFAYGADYRLLVIGHKLVAAARREPPQVKGDGRHSIVQLVEEANKDPRRGENHATSLSKLRLDEIAKGVLAEQGLTVDSVPAAGQVVLIRRNANLSTGGSATDVTDRVHPDVAARVIDGVTMVGLDIAGVDVVCQDISRPLEEQGGIIVEINAAPGLRMHLEPSSSRGRPVGEAIVGTMFEAGNDGRIPIVAVSGTNGKTTTTRLIAHVLRCTGKRVGMTCTDGVYLNDRRLDTGDCSGPKSARTVLANPAVEAAVLETARGGILREGLGFDLCNTAVVTNIADGDHLGINGIDTPEQLARVKRVIVESVAPDGYAVLNANDPLTVAMAEYCPGKVLFFAQSPVNPIIVAHRAKGGKVVYVRDKCIMAAEGSWEARIALLDSIPLTFAGLIGFQVENVMAAASTAWTLGIPFEKIRHALETFVNDTQTVPARFNVIQFHGSTVVIDYGHNAAALSALCDAFDKMPHERRLIVYTATGDRRDEDIIRQAELIANSFDLMILYEDSCTRGRKDGEVCRLMREGFVRGKRLLAENVIETRGEMKAIEMILRKMIPGDLVLIQADQVEEAIVFVQQLLPKLAAEQIVHQRLMLERR